MFSSPQLNELATALAKAQAALKVAIKDTNNTFFKSKYAPLSEVWEACRDALTSNGLSVIQAPVGGEDGRISLETVLLHSSGQCMSSICSTKLVKDDPQGVGSAITYLRRYALAAMVGVVADEDDDGNAASGVKVSTIPKPKDGAFKVLESEMRSSAGTEKYKTVIGTIDAHHQAGGITSEERGKLLTLHRQLTGKAA